MCKVKSKPLEHQTSLVLPPAFYQLSVLSLVTGSPGHLPPPAAAVLLIAAPPPEPLQADGHLPLQVWGKSQGMEWACEGSRPSSGVQHGQPWACSAVFSRQVRRSQSWISDEFPKRPAPQSPAHMSPAPPVTAARLQAAPRSTHHVPDSHSGSLFISTDGK